MRARPAIRVLMIVALVIAGMVAPGVSQWAIAVVPDTNGVAVSASTGRIAYVGTDRQVHVMNADGTGDTTLPTRGTAFTPHWSPTTGEIVYEEVLSERPRVYQLSVVDPATGATCCRTTISPTRIRRGPRTGDGSRLPNSATGTRAVSSSQPRHRRAAGAGHGLGGEHLHLLAGRHGDALVRWADR